MSYPAAYHSLLCAPSCAAAMPANKKRKTRFNLGDAREMKEIKKAQAAAEAEAEASGRGPDRLVWRMGARPDVGAGACCGG